jgi:hypothetical protein
VADELPVYTTRAECRRVALEAFDLWVPGLRRRIEFAIDRINKNEIQEGLWGPDALVELLDEAIRDHIEGTSLSNPAMATVVERDRLKANPTEPRPDHD